MIVYPKYHSYDMDDFKYQYWNYYFNIKILIFFLVFHPNVVKRVQIQEENLEPAPIFLISNVEEC